MVVREGDRVRVFDYRPWQITGDIGDNDCYFKPATVVRVYRRREYRPELIDVRFDHEPDRISHGHFADVLRPLRAPAEPPKGEPDGV